MVRAGWMTLLLASLAGQAEVRAQNPAADSAAVRTLDDQMRLAVLRRDITALERFWSEQLVVNAPNNQLVRGREDARAVGETFEAVTAIGDAPLVQLDVQSPMLSNSVQNERSGIAECRSMLTALRARDEAMSLHDPTSQPDPDSAVREGGAV